MIQARRGGVKVVASKWSWLRRLSLMVGLYLIWVLARGVADIRQAYRRIDEAKLRLVEAQKKNSQLNDRLVQVQTREYIEEVVRNDLNMQKEGETVVVIQQGAEGVERLEALEKKPEDIPNYLKWWGLVK